MDCLELANLQNFVAEKKWHLAVQCLQQILSKNKIEIDQHDLLNEVLKIDQKYLKLNAPAILNHLWKLAYDSGKIKIAKDFSITYLNFLLENKRVPALEQLNKDIIQRGLQKKYIDISLHIDHILGKRKAQNDWENYQELHPEYDKENEKNLIEYLTQQTIWTSADWKLCYEFILRHHYDETVFKKIISLMREDRKVHLLDQYKQLCAVNKKYKTLSENKISKLSNDKVEREENLSQIAFDYMVNPKPVSEVEQSKVIVSIMQMSNDELLERGTELMTSFGLLGLDRVVTVLGNKLLNILSDTKKRASVLYTIAQTLFETTRYYDCIDVCNDAIENEPLLEDEAIAFEYLRAESYLFLGNKERALGIYFNIKKKRVNYRLVNERLKAIESFK